MFLIKCIVFTFHTAFPKNIRLIITGLTKSTPRGQTPAMGVEYAKYDQYISLTVIDISFGLDTRLVIY